MTQPVAVVRPVAVTDANLISTTVPENDHPLYNPATVYAIGQRVLLGAPQHAIYESLSANNAGNFPPNSPAHWIYAGPSNAWKAYDLSGGTVMVAPGSDATPLEFVIAGDRATSISLLGVQASWVQIQASNPVDGIYYDRTIEVLDNAVVATWFDYFFAEIEKATQVIVLDIPPAMNSQYKVRIADASGTVKLSTFIMGLAVNMGLAEFGAQVGIIDFSKKLVDSFGRASLDPGPFSNRMSISMELPKGIVDSVYRRFIAFRATPCLWIGAFGQYESLTVFGFFRDFNIDISYPTFSICSAEIEGLSSTQE